MKRRFVPLLILIMSLEAFAAPGFFVHNRGGLGEFKFRDIVDQLPRIFQNCQSDGCGWSPAQKKVALLAVERLKKNPPPLLFLQGGDFDQLKSNFKIRTNGLATDPGAGSAIYIRSDRFFDSQGQYFSLPLLFREISQLVLRKYGADAESASLMSQNLGPDINRKAGLLNFASQGYPETGFLFDERGGVWFVEATKNYPLTKKLVEALECKTLSRFRTRKAEWDSLTGSQGLLRVSAQIHVDYICDSRPATKKIAVAGLVAVDNGSAEDFLSGRKGLQLRLKRKTLSFKPF
jgi:hypothetical protein